MKELFYILVPLLFTISCESQTVKSPSGKIVGGGCEGCEAIFEYGNKQLRAIDTLPAFETTNPKLKITGTVFQSDGKTPAENVIIYVYQTNREGLYVNLKNEQNWGRRHGSIRGWIRTGKDGKYTFYTFRPAAYPNGRESEHIHITVKEPNKNEYYIDEYVFNDDPLLTDAARGSLENRGGSGIVEPVLENNLWMVKRDIILGLNIPNYK